MIAFSKTWPKCGGYSSLSGKETKKRSGHDSVETKMKFLSDLATASLEAFQVSFGASLLPHQTPVTRASLTALRLFPSYEIYGIKE